MSDRDCPCAVEPVQGRCPWCDDCPSGEGFDARKVADKVRARLEAVGEWTDDDGVRLRMRDGRV